MRSLLIALTLAVASVLPAQERVVPPWTIDSFHVASQDIGPEAAIRLPVNAIAVLMLPNGEQLYFANAATFSDSIKAESYAPACVDTIASSHIPNGGVLKIGYQDTMLVEVHYRPAQSIVVGYRKRGREYEASGVLAAGPYLLRLREVYARAASGAATAPDTSTCGSPCRIERGVHDGRLPQRHAGVRPRVRGHDRVHAGRCAGARHAVR